MNERSFEIFRRGKSFSRERAVSNFAGKLGSVGKQLAFYETSEPLSLIIPGPNRPLRTF